MPWIISNGKSYVEINGMNQMITTCYIDRAHVFSNKKTAEKYCALLPKAMKNLKGNTYPGWIWKQFMENAHKDLPVLEFRQAIQIDSLE